MFKPVNIGKYEVIGVLGRGGMAEVYRVKALGEKGFEKEFAIKRVHAGFIDDPKVAKMFEAEARLTSILTHANIVQVFEFIKNSDDFFLVMEYIRGKNLAAVLRQVRNQELPLRLDIALYITNEVCKGLQYAHSKKDPKTGKSLDILHRDISPQNIMISYEGDVKIVDFGIARAMGVTRDTRTGSLAGKVAYMSPEQARGKKLDQSSDIFSLTLVLFEMITNKKMFDGASDIEILTAVQNFEFDPVVRELRDVPPAVANILSRGLDPNPTHRFNDVATMQAAIQQILVLNYPEMNQWNFASWVNQHCNLLEEVEVKAESGSDKLMGDALERLEKAFRQETSLSQKRWSSASLNQTNNESKPIKGGESVFRWRPGQAHSKRFLASCLTIVFFHTLGFLCFEFRNMGLLPGFMNNQAVHSVFVRVNSFFLDLHFRIRSPQKPKNNILLVSIDSEAVEQYGRWPWRRDLLALLSDRLFNHGTSALAWALDLSEEEKLIPQDLVNKLEKRQLGSLLSSFNTDQLLAKELTKYRTSSTLSWMSESSCQPKYFSSCPVSEPEAIDSIPEFMDNYRLKSVSLSAPFNVANTPVLSFATLIPVTDLFSQIPVGQGFSHSVIDPNGFIHRAALLGILKGNVHPSLELALANRHLPGPIRVSMGGFHEVTALEINQNFLSVMGNGTALINFRGPEGTFRTVSAAKILRGEGITQELDTLLHGALVYVGVTAPPIVERHATPTEVTMPRMEVQANVLDNILGNDFLVTTASERHPVLATIFLALFMIVAPLLLIFCMRDRPFLNLAIAFLVFCILVGIVDHLAFTAYHRAWATSFIYLELMWFVLLIVPYRYFVRKYVRSKSDIHSG